MFAAQNRARRPSAMLGLVLSIPLVASARTSDAQSCDGTSLRSPELVRIPGNIFLMGSPVSDPESFAYRSAERPQHEAAVAEFRMGRFLVTAEEFCGFLNDTGNKGYFVEDTGWRDWRTIQKVDGCYVPQEAAERCPAYPVTWAGATTYCEWLSSKLGRTFRLPTEAEWELAARGVEGRMWPWGNETPIHAAARRVTIPALDDDELGGPFPPYRVADPGKQIPFYDLCGLRWSIVPGDNDRPWVKAPIGSFPRNATPEGVYDMLGYYAGQWCVDCYDDKMHEAPLPITSDERSEKTLRVVRGMYHVPVDYASRHLPFLSVRWLIPGDAKWPQYTPGRVWSRMGLDPNEGAMFRLAESPQARQAR